MLQWVQLRSRALCRVVWFSLLTGLGCSAGQNPQASSPSAEVRPSGNSTSDPNARYRSGQSPNTPNPSLPASQQTAACNASPGANDAVAKRLMLRAMDVEYLNASFDQSLTLLNQAGTLCSNSQCSDTLGAKILMSVAVVQSNGKQNKELATQAIREALHRCASAVIERDYMTGELEKVFNEEKKNLSK